MLNCNVLFTRVHVGIEVASNTNRMSTRPPPPRALAEQAILARLKAPLQAHDCGAAHVAPVSRPPAITAEWADVLRRWFRLDQLISSKKVTPLGSQRILQLSEKFAKSFSRLRWQYDFYAKDIVGDVQSERPVAFEL